MEAQARHILGLLSTLNDEHRRDFGAVAKLTEIAEQDAEGEVARKKAAHQPQHGLARDVVRDLDEEHDERTFAQATSRLSSHLSHLSRVKPRQQSGIARVLCRLVRETRCDSLIFN